MLSARTELQQIDVAVFARAPVAGEVKTRLIPQLGAEGAAALQQAFIRRSLATALAAGVGPVSLWCTPDCQHPVFLACARELDVPLYAQRGVDLGARMFAAFARLGRRHATLLIGTDCPALTAVEIRTAAGSLMEGKDAVLVPAEDGGYVLIGLSHPVASLFHGIALGSGAVMAETRARLHGAGLCWQELAPSWDVDRPEDYERLRASGLLAELQAITPSIVGGMIDGAAHALPMSRESGWS
jgi:rSAM/selenodomain-associated transferase 1